MRARREKLRKRSTPELEGASLLVGESVEAGLEGSPRAAMRGGSMAIGAVLGVATSTVLDMVDHTVDCKRARGVPKVVLLHPTPWHGPVGARVAERESRRGSQRSASRGRVGVAASRSGGC